MIADSILNWKNYRFSDDMKAVFQFLEDKAFSIADGTYEIKGRDCYAMVQSYETMTDLPEKLETHQNYIDIQFWISGCERMVVAPAARLGLHTPYNPDKDVEFRLMPQDRDPAFLDMKPGEFMVLLPQDGHYGKVALPKHGPEKIRKVVVKIKKELF